MKVFLAAQEKPTHHGRGLKRKGFARQSATGNRPHDARVRTRRLPMVGLECEYSESTRSTCVAIHDTRGDDRPDATERAVARTRVRSRVRAWCARTEDKNRSRNGKAIRRRSAGETSRLYGNATRSRVSLELFNAENLGAASLGKPPTTVCQPKGTFVELRPTVLIPQYAVKQHRSSFNLKK